MRWLAVVTAVAMLLAGGAAGSAAARDEPLADAGGGVAVLPVPGRLLERFDPPAYRYAAGHRGVDLAAAPGDLVRAALPGVVRFSGEVARVGWVTVDHGGGLDTTYGPLDPRLVTAGDHVAAGDALGRLAPGAAHLDWGARLDGEYLDPLSLLGRWRVRLVPLPDDHVP